MALVFHPFFLSMVSQLFILFQFPPQDASASSSPYFSHASLSLSPSLLFLFFLSLTDHSMALVIATVVTYALVNRRASEREREREREPLTVPSVSQCMSKLEQSVTFELAPLAFLLITTNLSAILSLKATSHITYSHAFINTRHSPPFSLFLPAFLSSHSSPSPLLSSLSSLSHTQSSLIHP